MDQRRKLRSLSIQDSCRNQEWNQYKSQRAQEKEHQHTESDIDRHKSGRLAEIRNTWRHEEGCCQARE